MVGLAAVYRGFDPPYRVPGEARRVGRTTSTDGVRPNRPRAPQTTVTVVRLAAKYRGFDASYRFPAKRVGWVERHQQMA
jgi:hypothetical protein